MLYSMIIYSVLAVLESCTWDVEMEVHDILIKEVWYHMLCHIIYTSCMTLYNIQYEVGTICRYDIICQYTSSRYDIICPIFSWYLPNPWYRWVYNSFPMISWCFASVDFVPLQLWHPWMKPYIELSHPYVQYVRPHHTLSTCDHCQTT